jgi:glucosamine kinase
LKILIADSGSTKCDWLCIDEGGKTLGAFHTMGFNPFFHDADLVESRLRENANAASLADSVDRVYFYGAGSSSAELCDVIAAGLKRVFHQAKVYVGHDLDGAAFSTFTGESAITCIIGTGSNSCFFDGTQVREEVPALAYILGDEASGSWYGKKLLAAYLYGTLDEAVAFDFRDRIGLSKDEIFAQVYKGDSPNVFLASFMTFLARHQDVPQVRNWLREGFQAFVRVHIRCYAECDGVPVHFVGSVAYHFQEVLCEVMREEGLEVGSIIKRPIDGLAAYHVNYKMNTAH